MMSQQSDSFEELQAWVCCQLGAADHAQAYSCVQGRPQYADMDGWHDLPTPTQLRERLATAIARAEKAEQQVAMLTAALPTCPHHKPDGGARNGCLICAGENLQRALSRIDAAIHHPNEMEVSLYDLDCNEERVVAEVKALAARAEQAEAEIQRWRDLSARKDPDDMVVGIQELYHNWQSQMGRAEQAERERDEARAIPEGWQLVPKEPDTQMKHAGAVAAEWPQASLHDKVTAVYKAALSAAPPAPKAPVQAEPVCVHEWEDVLIEGYHHPYTVRRCKKCFADPPASTVAPTQQLRPVGQMKCGKTCARYPACMCGPAPK